MNKAYLLLGSNLSDPAYQLYIAKEKLSAIGIITKESLIYQTAAWGNQDQPDFLNQVIIMETYLTAENLMNYILRTESEMGRVRFNKNAPRLIDIDILFFNHEIIESPLVKIPHPAISMRRFVLVPLVELEPGYVHPVLKEQISDMLRNCIDPLSVEIFNKQ